MLFNIRAVLLVVATQIGAADGVNGASVYYGDKDCSKALIVHLGGECGNDFGCAVGKNIGISEFCVLDQAAYLKTAFVGSPYVLAEFYVDSACIALEYSSAFLADGICHTFDDFNGNTESMKTAVDDNGTMAVIGTQGNCSASQTFYQLRPVPKTNINTGACISIEVPPRDEGSSTLGAKFYFVDSSTSEPTNSSSPSANTTTSDSSGADSIGVRPALLLVFAALIVFCSNYW